MFALLLFKAEGREQALSILLTALAIGDWWAQILSDLEVKVDLLPACLQLKNRQNFQYGVFWFEFNSDALKLLPFEKLVVHLVVYEVEQDLSLVLHESAVAEDALVLLHLNVAKDDRNQQVDDEDDRAEWSAQFVSQIFITLPHPFQLCLVFIVFTRQGEIGHFLGDVYQEDQCYGLL